MCPGLSGQLLTAAFQFNITAAVTHNSSAFFPPSAAVMPASFNWLIFWQRAGQIGEAGSISRAHQHPQEALSPHSACVCLCVYSVIEKVLVKWAVGMDRVI